MYYDEQNILSIKQLSIQTLINLTYEYEAL